MKSLHPIIAFVVFFSFLLSGPASDRMTNEKNQASAKPFDDYLLVQSVPQDAAVHLISKQDRKDKWYEEETTLIGRTPLKHKLSPGSYVVAVLSDKLEGLDLRPAVPQSPWASQEEWMLNDGGEKIEILQIVAVPPEQGSGTTIKFTHCGEYEVEKEHNKPYAFTAVLARDRVKLATLLQLLPQKRVFGFDINQQAWSHFLKKLEFSDAEIPDALQFLSLTGVLPMKERFVRLNFEQLVMGNMVCEEMEQKELIQTTLNILDGKSKVSYRTIVTK